MTRLLKLLTFFFIFCFFAQANAQKLFFPCYTQINDSFYNISALSDTQMRAPAAVGSYTFYLQVCNVAPSCASEGAMACQISNTQTTIIYGTAFPNDDVAMHYWTVLNATSTTPAGIMLVSFGEGIYCNTPAEGNERKTTISVFCAPNITTIPTTLSPVIENPTCTYNMVIYHASGCAQPLPPTPMPTPTPTPPGMICSCSTDDSKITGAGVGVGVVVGSVFMGCVGIVFLFINRRRSGGGKASKWNKMDDDNDKVHMSTLPETNRGDEPTMNN